MKPEDYFRDLHIYELKRRDSIDGFLSVPLGLLTLIGGGAYGLSSSIARPFTHADFAAIFLLWVALCSLVLAGYELWRLAINKGYHYPAYARDAETHLKKIRDWAAAKGKSNPDAEFVDSLTEEFIRCAHINAQVNDNRSKHKHKLKQFLLIALAALASSGFVLTMSNIITVN